MAITNKVLTTAYADSISADGNDVAVYNPTGGFVYDFNVPVNSVYFINSGYYPQISGTSSQIAYEYNAGATYQIALKTINSSAPATPISTGTMGAANSSAYEPYISANGQVVAFTSAATNLDPRGTMFGGNYEVYRYSGGVVSVVSQTSDGSQVANGFTIGTSISADGSAIGFYSQATNLASLTPSDQAEVYTSKNGVLTLVSVASDKVTIADKSSVNISLDRDGNIAAFESTADNLGVANNGASEIYVKDLTTGQLTLASSTSGGVAATSSAVGAEISADGQYVAFQSAAANLPGANGQTQVYIKNMLTGAIALASQNATGAGGNGTSDTTPAGLAGGEAFSADDSRFVYTSFATTLGASTSGSALLASDTAPTDTLDPVNGGAALQDTKATAVTFSGTATPGSQFVDVFLDGSKTPVATNVAVDALTGKWTTAGLDLSSLGVGTHSVTAVVQGSGWLSSSSSENFTINGTPGTTSPTVGINTGVKFAGTSNATFTGTFAETKNPVTTITLMDGGQVIGTEAVNGNSGTWSIAAALGAGDHAISATATDSSGQTSAVTPAPFSLTTGIKGAPYASDEEDFSNGQLVGETFTGARGAVYQQDTVTNNANSHVLDITSGRYFAGKPFTEEADTYSLDYSSLDQQTLSNRDGTHTIQGFSSGQVLTSVADDTFTNDAFRETFKFQPHFGQDLITDFQVGGPRHDFLSLSASEFGGIAGVLNRTSDVDGNATIAVSPRDSITLQGVTTAELRANSGDIRLHH